VDAVGEVSARVLVVISRSKPHEGRLFPESGGSPFGRGDGIHAREVDWPKGDER
jgi:hypothetical protein